LLSLTSYLFSDDLVLSLKLSEERGETPSFFVCRERERERERERKGEKRKEREETK